MNDAAEGRPMDRRDLELLTDILDLHEELDPTPPMLADLVLFALQDEGHGTDLDAEFARLLEEELTVPVGARTVEQARRVTFSSDHLTVMITVGPRGDGTVRLDGWAAPGGGLRAELRTDAGLLTTTCDAAGRFVFPEVPSGLAQLTLLPTADSDPEVRVPVVTPAVNL
jgi:hypothetical protein